MFFGFNRRKKVEQVLQRNSLSDAEFIARIELLELPSELIAPTIRAYRSMLGELYGIPPEKIYPNDSFREFSCLQTRDWGILELIFLIEDILKIDIYEEKVPDLTMTMNMGEWIKRLLLNIFSE
ncbi:hypothetical protein [Spirulina sp. 06S082]|uniref:hypothetical protein n=1 Tax=Spirulina sp. 06S082 TaxID=3110248 RepID=UPI002B1F692C|nr:hypothetical protein [Spirulina sp. 06S082]MEA5472336.1 hypothetical protein [Spirulina sp. 06S082]